MTHNGSQIPKHPTMEHAAELVIKLRGVERTERRLDRVGSVNLLSALSKLHEARHDEAKSDHQTNVRWHRGRCRDLTNIQIATYVAKAGDWCPFCAHTGTVDRDLYKRYVEGDKVRQRVFCAECRKSWIDVYGTWLESVVMP